LKVALDFLSIKKLAVRYQIGIFETAVLRFFLFSDLLWNFFSCCSWEELGRVGAMPPYNLPKIFGNFFGNSEVKMSLNVDNGIC
jgi:hypothetical protein